MQSLNVQLSIQRRKTTAESKKKQKSPDLTKIPIYVQGFYL